ncbi:MAG: DUF885 domain-containing protein [Verrucomicrobia bacterium]|nr:DUF885 domain-containing protein [Verrucomicrobiota bacterium]
MRKSLKLLGALAGLAALATAVFLTNLVWFRPWSLNLFYEKVFVAFALENPELLTSIGIAEKFGYRRHNARLADASIEKTLRDLARARQNLAELRAYDFARQTPSQQLSTRTLAWFLENSLAGEKFAFHNYPVNQLFGIQSSLPDFMANLHRVPDAKGAEHYLARLGEWGRKFDQVIAGLEYREARGIIPPRFVVQRVLVEMRAFVGRPARENLLFTGFAAKIDALPILPEAEKTAFKTRVEAAITGQVYPAYQRLMATMAALEAKATDDDGVWKLPAGDAFYAHQLQTYTTTKLTPAEVHTIGLREVEHLEREMRALLEAQGHLGGTPAAWLLRLKTEPRFLYPNDDAGRTAALGDYQRIIDECLKTTPKYFGLQPKARLEVRRIPEFKEKTAPGAYYQRPALDGSRPGVFFANLRNMAEVAKFGMKTLAYHEGVPGHHFQIAIAQELKGLPTFRGMLPFTAYTEGWALYTEWFAREMGLYRDDPHGDLGRLQADVFRAVRLVVDTGIHCKRWTRAEAIAYMIDHTGMGRDEVTAEIERYIVNPGQACAYKIGQIKFLELRTRVRARLGAKFDDRAFHDLLLGSGALPLEILEEQVDAWLAAAAPH